MTVQKEDLSAAEWKTLTRLSKPGPYVGLDHKAVQRLIALDLVRQTAGSFMLTRDAFALLRA